MLLSIYIIARYIISLFIYVSVIAYDYDTLTMILHLPTRWYPIQYAFYSQQVFSWYGCRHGRHGPLASRHN